MKTKQVALRFDEELIELVRAKAKAQRRSLNNYIEFLLYNDVGNIPNEETKSAIEEARNSDNLAPIDDLGKFLDEL
ncbi:hypothetical protein [Flagellimonas myxillae]|uniref:hypothetical protein n=1 Tax=Flagellimonas myxillae TaxID=2942214 RepID=UPI00201EDC13|nr:hypothetical protein [Muricauda myxillae]MCL6267126.1 hypothetical protein [Muricauda myxillae]